MSIRAYRVIEIKLEDEPSFNLFEDKELSNYLAVEADLFDSIDSDGSGYIGVPVKVLQKAVKKSSKLGIDEKTVERLKRDIEAAKTNKDECVDYFFV